MNYPQKSEKISVLKYVKELLERTNTVIYDRTITVIDEIICL